VQVAQDRVVRLRFDNVGKLPPPVLQFSDVTFGYSPDRILYKHVDLGVDLDSRVAIVGPNGTGKSTLLKLMVVSGRARPASRALHPAGLLPSSTHAAGPMLWSRTVTAALLVVAVACPGCCCCCCCCCLPGGPPGCRLWLPRRARWSRWTAWSSATTTCALGSTTST